MTEIEPQTAGVDIVCVGFGPATAGFLTTLAGRILNSDGSLNLESRKLPGMPLQVICYERADDFGFGVSGVVSKATAIRASLPDLRPEEIPMTIEVKKEKLVYLLDPHGASRRTRLHRLFDGLLKPFARNYAVEAPFIPKPLNKHGGLIFSIGQFSQWVAGRILSTGAVQLWPATPVSAPLFDGDRVIGVRLSDQGVDKQGTPDVGFMPGMDIHAELTVVGDGPVGFIGRQLEEKLGVPEEFERKDWAVGMKFVVELPEHSTLEPGTVIHTLGYPEPEIFGFLYVHPDRVASLGIFVPSWFDNPARTAYRYLQYWMMHPYFWKDLQGGVLRSWGAKSIQESGKRGEPFLVGDGYARIGEGSGTTNIFLNSGVDEAWESGVLLAEATEELLKSGKSFTRENLEQTYLRKRRSSRLEKEAVAAQGARDGFQKGFFLGLLGMGLAMISAGRLKLPVRVRSAQEREPDLVRFFKGKLAPEEIRRIQQEAYAQGKAANEALMRAAGWPDIPYDGRLLVSHQDALLTGGKVQAPAGYKDHVVFIYPHLCESCTNKLCIEMCSGQAILPGADGVPEFDREKCIHCGACLWNCVKTLPEDPTRTNVSFQAGAGGLHSVEN
ncbi:MAG: 4Fe-4S ferredoxin [candidate division KSB1 bacterium]|nr:4Fe-4S ferredoxin [candidate division KSB1 bacterium]